MNHEMFERRFIEILMSEGVDVNKNMYHLHPIEENKKYNSMDDMFRLVVCAPLNELEIKELNFDQVIHIFTWRRDIYPMWIDICIGDDGIIDIYFSRRFRKFSEVCMGKNKDSAPFRLINKSEANRY